MAICKPNYLWKTPSPNTIKWGVRALTYELFFGGGREHKHSVHDKALEMGAKGIKVTWWTEHMTLPSRPFETPVNDVKGE